MFNFSDIKNIEWKGIHIGIKGSNIGEEQLLNHIILLMKYMIYVNSKTKNNPPTPQDIKNKILENKKEERNLAEQRGTLSSHFRKWDNFPC